MATLNWQLREHLHRFREPGDGRECRLDVLLSLALHMNQRGRTWVKRDTIAREIGVNEGQVSHALQWLFNKGAIYNVPYRYRVGAERDLEPRKYVFQLTGIIRFDENLVVPYLYLNNLEDEIANTLRELADIGGEGLVAFLTQGSDSEPLLFGQGSDSEHSDSERSDSEHKGSTVLEGSTGSEDDLNLSARKILADAPNPYLTTFPAMQQDAGDRSGEQTVVETSKGESVVPGQENWTAFEKWVLTALRKTSLTEQQRGYFNQIGFYVLEGSTEALERPTVNEAWDKWPSFQRYVVEKIVPAMKTKNMFNVRGFNNWLNSPETWRNYMSWPGREDDPTSADGAAHEEEGRYVTMPDGVEIWVPSTMTPTEALKEYLRGKNK